MKKFFFCFSLLFLLTPSCKNLDSNKKILTESSSQIRGNKKADAENFSIIFSHDINGELRPCGCQSHPLGGLPQVAGKISEISNSGPYIYVDIGDTFFSNHVVPESMEATLLQTAETLSEGLSLMNLSYFVPGEKDFANGKEELIKLARRSKVQILIGNLNEKRIPHKKFDIVNFKNHKLYIIGIVNPDLFTLLGSKAPHFLPPMEELKKILKEIEDQHDYNKDNPNHQLIVLSHSGFEFDKKMAQNFSQIDWIIGSHSLGFFQKPKWIGSTRIAQALYQNHYLGQIRPFKPKSLKSIPSENTIDKNVYSDYYVLHAIYDHYKKSLKPNPLDNLLSVHDSKIRKLQEEEQKKFNNQFSSTDRLPTYVSCLECHDKQKKKWSKTAHSLAYWTLIQKKQEKNLQCIPCHTLGHQTPQGLKNLNEITLAHSGIDDGKSTPVPMTYWKELTGKFGKINSVRQLTQTKRTQYRNDWYKLNEKYKVTDNYANVQCLHCHDQSSNHPFEITSNRPTAQKKMAKMQQACLKCHTKDQSPSWYHLDGRGLRTTVNLKKLKKLIKTISCPKNKT